MAAKIVGRAKALADSKPAKASPDLAGHLATFRARLEADGEDAVGTVAYAQAVVDLARVEGITVPSPAKKTAAGSGSTTRRASS